MARRARPFPRSLRLRFALAILLWIAAGFVLIGFSLSSLVRRHVEAQFHDELAVHLEELAALTRLTPEGAPYLDRPLSDPRYAMPGSGFYWQVEREGHAPLRSGSMPQGTLDPELAHQPHIVHRLAPGPTGPTMTYGFAAPAPDGGPELHFLIATDERILNEVIAAFDRDLGRWLALLALGLFGTGSLVMLYVLRPLDRLGRAIAAVRHGSAHRMETGWPAEIEPLVDELNELLDTTDTMVSRARLEAGNLAHHLRTSLAILTDEAETLARGPAGDSATTLIEQCRRIARQLDWHLARARAGARAGAGTAIPQAILPIATAIERLHAGRGVRFVVGSGPAARLAVDEADFAEILSNLADNAGKWARTQVAIAWGVRAGEAVIQIVDDGPGIPEAQREAVFAAGTRLDERAPGHGLGLAIARDLARRYGGEIRLRGRDDGEDGLVVCLVLPLGAGGGQVADGRAAAARGSEWCRLSEPVRSFGPCRGGSWRFNSLI